MRLKITLLLLTSLLLNTYSFGQARKYSTEFLSIGIGARALGMSNSVVATTNDVTSTFWNPSALVLSPEKIQIGLMHNEGFGGIEKFDFIGVSSKINDSSSIGFSLIRLGVDDIPNTLELVDNNGNFNYDRISTFSEADYCFLVSYAKKSKIQNFRYGGNLKIIRRIMGSFASAWGFGLDASAQYDYKKWRFGLLVRDVTSTFNAWSYNNSSKLIEVFENTGNEIPKNSVELIMPKIILGSGYNFNIYKKFSGLAEIDVDVTTDGKRNVLVVGNPFSLDPHLGMEFNYNELIFLRLGVGTFQKIPVFDGKTALNYQPDLGVGIKYKNFAVDYALANVTEEGVGLYSNVFSLKYSFNKIKK